MKMIDAETGDEILYSLERLYGHCGIDPTPDGFEYDSNGTQLDWETSKSIGFLTEDYRDVHFTNVVVVDEQDNVLFRFNSKGEKIPCVS